MNKEFTLTINEESTVKEILTKNLNLSAQLITNLKKYNDGILLNGKKVNVNAKLTFGDKLKIKIYDEKSDIKPKNIPFNILYEDEDIIVLNKDRNIPTHPSQNHYEDTLANALMYYFKDENFTFRAITRLDKDTSGIVLVAKNPYSSHILNEDMKNKKIKKEYFAIINGALKEKSGVIDAPIKRCENTVMKREVSPFGKEAITEYETVKVSGDYSLVHLFPITGRTHQLRVHLSYLGCAIYGDDLYGAPQKDGIKLHCGVLEFLHPSAKEKIKIEAPMPKDMEEIINPK